MKTGKKWLIAGASHGLGLAAVKYLLTKGQRVISLVADTRHLSVEMLNNPQLEIIVLNPASENEVLRMCENLFAKYGQIDKMVNNAGATRFMIQHILPLMQGNGHFIELLPGCGPASIADSTTEHAVRYGVGLSEDLFLQANNMGIKVTIIGQASPVPIFSDN